MTLFADLDGKIDTIRQPRQEKLGKNKEGRKRSEHGYMRYKKTTAPLNVGGRDTDTNREQGTVPNDLVLEQAILRGDVDAVQDALVMDIMGNIADLVIRGEPLPHIPQTMDILQNKDQVAEIQTTSEGENEIELPELSFLHYDTDQMWSAPLKKGRGKIPKKVTLGVTTRSKKSY